MRYTCLLSILLVAGCAGPQVKNVTGPGGAPAYAITCYNDRGLCYRAAYDTCKGGYYILDAAAVSRGDTGRYETINQDRPGRPRHDHTLLVQCTHTPTLDPLLADVGADRGRYPYARYAAPVAPRGSTATTTQDPLLLQLQGSGAVQPRTSVRRVYGPLPPANMRLNQRRARTYGGDPYDKTPYYSNDPYLKGQSVAPYSEAAVPPYPGYRGSRYGRRWRKRTSSKKKTPKVKAAKKSADDCACP